MPVWLSPYTSSFTSGLISPLNNSVNTMASNSVNNVSTSANDLKANQSQCQLDLLILTLVSRVAVPPIHLLAYSLVHKKTPQIDPVYTQLLTVPDNRPANYSNSLIRKFFFSWNNLGPQSSRRSRHRFNRLKSTTNQPLKFMAYILWSAAASSMYWRYHRNVEQ